MSYLREKKILNREEPAAPSRNHFLERWFKISRLSYPVPPHARTLPYTLGGITFVGFLLLLVSGLLLGQFFNPDPERSYESIKYLVEEVPSGIFLRAFHYWTAQAVIFVLLMHLLRVFVTGAYKPPRLFTWYFGVALLATALLGSYFSGTVLKWDQESFEALAHYQEGLRIFGPIGALMGSAEAIALNIKLYLSHVSLFPLLLIALIAGHFYLINVFNLSPLPFGEDSARAHLPSERMTGKFLEHSKSILIYGVYYGVATIAFIFPAPLGPPNSGKRSAPSHPGLSFGFMALRISPAGAVPLFIPQEHYFFCSFSYRFWIGVRSEILGGGLGRWRGDPSSHRQFLHLCDHCAAESPSTRRGRSTPFRRQST